MKKQKLLYIVVGITILICVALIYNAFNVAGSRSGASVADAFQTNTSESTLRPTATPFSSVAPTLRPTATPFSSVAPTLRPTTQSTLTPYVIEEPSDVVTITVYITDTGSKYHRAGCRYLAHSCHAVDLDWAISHGYEPCSVCKPPG